MSHADRCLTTCNMAGLSDEQQTSLHFLLRATSLRQAAQAGVAGAAPRYAALCSLAGTAGPAELGSVEVRELHGRLGHALAAAGAAVAAGGRFTSALGVHFHSGGESHILISQQV